jgi:AhpD family alkylhydroperoxidase
MTEALYPKPSKVLAQKRSALAPEIDAAFRQFSTAVFQDGALPRKIKQLIAVAVAHVTQCPYCIQGHTKAAAARARRPRRSWKRSGSRPRCAPAERSPIR